MTADEAWTITVRASYAPEDVVKKLMEGVLLQAESGYSYLLTPIKTLELHCPNEASLLEVVDVISRLGYAVTLTDRAITIRWKKKPQTNPTQPNQRIKDVIRKARMIALSTEKDEVARKRMKLTEALAEVDRLKALLQNDHPTNQPNYEQFGR